MRLLGGILRPSLNQVTCGWGKLRMRGAQTTAPSPWETDWVRSPSSKLPITTGRQTHKDRRTQERVRKGKTHTNLPLLPCIWLLVPAELFAICFSVVKCYSEPQWWTTQCCCHGVCSTSRKAGRNRDVTAHGERTLNWLIFIFRSLLCGGIKGNQSWSGSKCVHYST